MAYRTEYCLRQGGLIPGAVVTSVVDEEGRRDPRSAANRAFCLVADSCFYRTLDPGVARGADRHPELGGNLVEIMIIESVAALHESVVRPPEIAARGKRVFRQLRGMRGQQAVFERQVSVDVAQPVAEFLAQIANDSVSGMAVLTRIAAILDQRHVGVGVTEDVIAGKIDRADQTCGVL